MGGELAMRRSTAPRRPAGAPGRARPSAPRGGSADRILELQRQAGNRAVVRLLTREQRTSDPRIQRAGSHPENAPVGTLTPPGSLTEAQWTAAYRAAKAEPSPAAFEPLIRDIAVTAGMAALGAGFVPARIPLSDGETTAKPGLNMTMNARDKHGHAGWVDGNGAYGVRFQLDKGKPTDRQIAVILSIGMLNADKGLSLNTVRHEMVHVRHKQKVLEAVKAWQSLPVRGRPSFGDWLGQQTRRRKGAMSALDAALIGKGVQDAAANTEVLAYVEGFVNTFHRRAPTLAEAGPAFFELLGAVETDKLYTWRQADPAVKDEALTRLREYHATLDLPRQRLWKQWLDQQLGRVGKDVENGKARKDFLTRLGAFVR